MGCGIGDFARRGLKMPKTQDFWVFILSPGDLDSQRHMGPRLAAQGTLTRSAGDLDLQRQLRSLEQVCKNNCNVYMQNFLTSLSEHVLL